MILLIAKERERERRKERRRMKGREKEKDKKERALRSIVSTFTTIIRKLNSCFLSLSLSLLLVFLLSISMESKRERCIKNHTYVSNILMMQSNEENFFNSIFLVQKSQVVTIEMYQPSLPLKSNVSDRNVSNRNVSNRNVSNRNVPNQMYQIEMYQMYQPSISPPSSPRENPFSRSFTAVMTEATPERSSSSVVLVASAPLPSFPFTRPLLP